jgi:peptide/nickel transport system ATP-binding protein
MEENKIEREHPRGHHGEHHPEGGERHGHRGRHHGENYRDRRQAKKGDELVHIENLYVEYTAGKKIVHAVNNVSFDIKRGEAVALVGESGCGKSTIAKAILRILPDHGARMGGKILFEDQDLVTLPEKEMEHIRGDKISMVFQDPMTALNPVKKIITQVSGVIRLHNPEMSKAQAKEQAMQMLELVGITRDRVNDYPHQFSGGQQQRVVVAIGLACDPDLLLADEPTTALDVTIQAQVLDMMTSLIRKTNTAMLMITHNLGIVAETCDYVAVLYGGEIVEYGSIREIFKNPSHPYTIGLFGALPDLHGTGNRLKPIEGIMPEPSDLPSGCKFHTRCPYATETCSDGPVPVVDLGGTHRCQCHNIEAVREAAKKEVES